MRLQFTLELFLHILPHTFSLDLKLSGRLAFFALSEPLDIKLLFEDVSGLKVIDDHFLNCVNVFGEELYEKDQNVYLFSLGFLESLGKVLGHQFIDDFLPERCDLGIKLVLLECLEP